MLNITRPPASRRAAPGHVGAQAPHGGIRDRRGTFLCTFRGKPVNRHRPV